MLNIKSMALGGVTSIALLFGGYYAYQTMNNDSNSICSGGKPVFIPTNGGDLLAGKILRSQTLATKHVLTIAHIPIPICSNLTNLTVSSETNYKVKLEKRWKILLRDTGKEIIVIAPPIEPLLPVNHDTGKIKVQVSGCPLLNSASIINSMNKGVSAQLAQIAVSPEFVTLARNEGRPVISKFIKEWVVHDGQYKRAASYAIKVFYADEPVTYY